MLQLVTSTSPVCFQNSSLPRPGNEAADEEGVAALGKRFQFNAQHVQLWIFY